MGGLLRMSSRVERQHTATTMLVQNIRLPTCFRPSSGLSSSGETKKEGMMKPRPIPTMLLTDMMEVAAMRFLLLNQTEAILAGEFMMKGWPIPATMLPSSMKRKEWLTKTLRKEPTRVQRAPTQI